MNDGLSCSGSVSRPGRRWHHQTTVATTGRLVYFTRAVVIVSLLLTPTYSDKISNAAHAVERRAVDTLSSRIEDLLASAHSASGGSALTAVDVGAATAAAEVPGNNSHSTAKHRENSSSSGRDDAQRQEEGQAAELLSSMVQKHFTPQHTVTGAPQRTDAGQGSVEVDQPAGWRQKIMQAMSPLSLAANLWSTCVTTSPARVNVVQTFYTIQVRSGMQDWTIDVNESKLYVLLHAVIVVSHKTVVHAVRRYVNKRATPQNIARKRQEIGNLSQAEPHIC